MAKSVEDFYNDWQVNRIRKGDYEDMIEFAKDYARQLKLCGVSNQRELLTDFYRSLEDTEYLYPDECDMHIDNFEEDL